MGPNLEVVGIPGIPRVGAGDDLGQLIGDALDRGGLHLKGGDVVVVAQSVVSRSEGSVVRLEDVTPSRRAVEYARITGKDPRVVQVVLDESCLVVLATEGFMLCETRNGLVCANAGVDASNNEEGFVSVLPRDADASALSISKSLEARTGIDVPVLVSDTEGRPFRRGAIGVAVGVHGVRPVSSLRGKADLFGRTLETTEVCVADMLCSAAALVMGEAAEGIPAAVIRGASFEIGGSSREIRYEVDAIKSRIIEMDEGRCPDDNSDD